MKLPSSVVALSLVGLAALSVLVPSYSADRLTPQAEAGIAAKAQPAQARSGAVSNQIVKPAAEPVAPLPASAASAAPASAASR